MFNFLHLGLILSLVVICVSEEDVSSPADDEENTEEVFEEEEEEDEQPPYEIPNPDAFFLETFSSPLESLDWVVSKHSEGELKVGRGTQTSGIKSEQGLILQDEAKRYATSCKFGSDFNTAHQDFVFQYEVRFHNAHQCGGSYMKVLKSDPDFDQEEFNGDTDYIVMFGPDKCGSTDKVHFIFKHKHKITGEFEEKHLKSPPSIKNDQLTHLYTLVIRTDNTYEIFIDQESVSKGELLNDFEPPVNPPKEIDDPDDKKPEDWVDEAKINDPDASKPDDWDEDAPKEIVDEDATQPSGWEVDEPFQIPDPGAEEPEDWDSEDDGEWEAPLVDNPACSVGCGEWEAPIIPNPDYKGKWIHPKIDNPDYKGVWEPKQIENPNYFEDSEPHELFAMGAVGIEIWTMQNQIEFDNVFVDGSLDAAIEFGKATWALKYQVEKAAQDKKDGSDLGVMAALSGLMGPVYSFMDYCEANPFQGIGICCLIILVIGLFIWLLCKLCCGPEESDEHDHAHGHGHVRREVAEDEEDDDDSGDEEGESEGTREKQEEGVDKVKEKKELEKKKTAKGSKEQKKQQPVKKKRSKKSRKAD